MIKEINIKQYRKLKNINFEFLKGVNIISGTNGTCKTSLLHIISNSFQAVNKKVEWLEDVKVLETIKALNKLNNPKIETLTRGDNEYNDPAFGVKGTLFTCKYYNEKILEFRRHNSTKDNIHRFALKPPYSKGKSESLPLLPVIYLGLFRLFSFGEFDKDDDIKQISKKIPDDYLEEIKNLYKDFTGIEIEYKNQSDMGGIKNRAEFKSTKDGVDSNTISAGEDNLLIILTALVSLKYYFENITREKNEVESLLLIDEIDASLHPAFQIRLLDLFKEYSEKYKIQVIFTTHSISLLEYALSQKQKVIYLIDNIDEVSIMEPVDKYKIEMFLKNKAKKDIYLPKSIPIFTEDEEARFFLKGLIDFYNTQDESFKKISTMFHFVKANLSCEALRSIFQDDEILRSTMRAICILDGDQNFEIKKHIIKLPGDKSPEIFLFQYAEHLYNNNLDFWNDVDVQEQGFTKLFYRDNVKKEIESIERKIQELAEMGKSSKGKRREESKKIFNEYITFFSFIMKYWLNDETNKDKIEEFFKNLNILFKKVAIFHGINPNDWNII